MISEQEVKKAIQTRRLGVITLANNELGTIQPIRSIASVVEAERLKRLKKGDKTPIYFHTDASQGAGQLDINVARLGIDMLTLIASKIYGPKQTGLLWVSSKVRLQPQILGGGQERGFAQQWHRKRC
jgi:cysteine desulfurase